MRYDLYIDICLKYQYQTMILDIQRTNPSLPKKTNWKDQFRTSIYARNKMMMNQNKPSQTKISQEAIEVAGLKIMEILDAEENITIRDQTNSEGCHTYYSSFIPLKMQTKFDDQLDTTFPYLKYLNEKGRNNDRLTIVYKICQQMRSSKEGMAVMSGWKKCLQEYICGLDIIRAIQIYLQIKKRGTSVFGDLHRIYGDKCQQIVFFQRVCNAGRYFGSHLQQKSQGMPLSIDSTQQINEVSMPKTMKMLFCSICLTYDCTRHTLDETFKQKQFQYVSPENINSQERKLHTAIIICQAQKQLFSKSKLQWDNPCSQECFKLLTNQTWKNLSKMRAVLTSPIVKGIIKMGIQMHGYSPCLIYPLLNHIILIKGSHSIPCSLVFLYFIQQYNIYSRLQKKLANSEIQMLQKVSQQGKCSMPEPIHKKKKNLLGHQHTQVLSTCGHYFVGQKPSDEMCMNCGCQERGFCFPQCLCSPQCPLRKRGCNCRKDECRTKRCVCFNSSMECDPSLCLGCFTERSKCRNNGILLHQFKKVRIGRSTLPGAGLGLFVAETIQKDDLVMIYAGEIIDSNVDLLRQSLSVDLNFYNFNSKQGIVDARFMGNLSRFINHGNQGQQNLCAKDVMSEGRYKVAFYSQRLIESGQQLFFNYDGQGQIYANFSQKYPFIKNSRKIARQPKV